MNLNEFKDRLFDILNETDHLPIKDIDAEDRADIIRICLSDESMFKIQCECCKEGESKFQCQV